jgi:hypothetical protein
MHLEAAGSLLGEEIICSDCFGLKSVEELCYPPAGFELMSRTSVVLTAQYLNVRQRKLGTIMIQTVHILQHDSADTAHCSWGTF